MSLVDNPRNPFGRTQTLALIAGVGGLAACAGACVDWPRDFFPAYLVGYLFWVGIALGCTSLLLLHNLTGGQWGLTIRRPLEAGAMTILPMAVLFVPIILGLKSIYPWMDPEIVKANPAVQHKQKYLNESFFLIRAGIYFAYWVLMAILLHAGAVRRDPKGGPTRAAWLTNISGPGLALLFLHRLVRCDRLGDVARASVVLDDLWSDGHRRLGPAHVRDDDPRRLLPSAGSRRNIGRPRRRRGFRISAT